MANYRWVICAMLFLATTINYMDRQVLSLTWADFIKPEFQWNDDDYGTITSFFSIFYAVISLFAGKFIDWMGTRKGYIWAIVVWSLGACLHAGCGWVAVRAEGLSSVDEFMLMDKAAQISLMGLTLSVWLFIACRMILAGGEAGNFPAAIKVTAEFFPKKDRALATSIFNSGASIGALVAPLSIPVLAKQWGWEMSFVIIGALGFVWAGLWLFAYDKPTDCRFMNETELAYINSADGAAPVSDEEDKTFVAGDFSIIDCFMYRQTWAFIVGKLLTDGVWWFFLFWAPAYFSDQYGYTSDSSMGIALIFTLYAIVTILSIGGGYLPKYFVEKRGMNPYLGRMRAMFIFACFPVLGLLAQPLGTYSAWWPAILIGLLGAGHQAWSANLFSTVGDMFPKSTIGTLVGLGTMAGGLGSMSINYGSGVFFKWAAEQGSAYTFFGFEGKPAAYMVVFCICAVAYLIGWTIMKALVPKYKPVVAND